jgi:hypothetical protein
MIVPVREIEKKIKGELSAEIQEILEDFQKCENDKL